MKKEEEQKKERKTNGKEKMVRTSDKCFIINSWLSSIHESFLKNAFLHSTFTKTNHSILISNKHSIKMTVPQGRSCTVWSDPNQIPDTQYFNDISQFSIWWNSKGGVSFVTKSIIWFHSEASFLTKRHGFQCYKDAQYQNV